MVQFEIKTPTLSSIRESENVPPGWQSARGKVKKVRVKNKEILRELRRRLPGDWRKVYQRGTDGSSVHYFEHKSTGKVWGVRYQPPGEG